MDSIDSYIQLFLTGSLDAKSHAVLRQWIKEKPEHREYFRNLVVVWKAAGIVSNADGFEMEKAIGKFNKDTETNHRIVVYRRMLTISAIAIVFLLCGVSSLLFLWRAERMATEVAEAYQEYIVEVPAGAKSQITFPDGSIAWLNAGSKVRYDSNFGKESRNIELCGEGYFEVNKNKELPFIVNTEKLTVRVLGTKFNLKSYEEDSEVKVTLKEGAVAVGNLQIDTTQVILEPNQQLTYRKVDNMMRLDVVDATHIENWRDGAMSFDKVSLEEIAKELKRQYNIPIRIEDDKLKRIVYYSDFQKNVTIQKVMEILSSGNKFRYEIKPEFIRIYN